MSSRVYFETLAEVVYECLGEDHPCSQQFIRARSHLDEVTIDKALATVRRLPKVYRDRVLMTAKQRLKDELYFSKWLAEKVSTRH